MLAGITFEVRTDHKNLIYFLEKQHLAERQLRWGHELSGFNFKLVHVPGTDQIQADALSRRQQDMPRGREDERLQDRHRQLLQQEGPDLVITAAWNANADADPDIPQAASSRNPDSRTLDSPFSDPALSDLWHKGLQNNQRYWEAHDLVKDSARSFPKDWGLPWQISECTLDAFDRLCWRRRLWIPHFEPLRTQLIQGIHDSPLAGHPGRTITRDLVSREYAWPGLTDDVRRFVANCNICGQGKVWREQKRGLLKPLPVPDRFWQEIAMDFIVDLPPSKGHTNILGITDRLSKSMILIPLSDISAPAVADAFLRHFICLHGPPRAIVSDRGPQFTGLFWKTVCQHLGITQRLSTAFHPETDGAQERSNQEIENYLRAYSSFAQDNWADLLPVAQLALNNRVASSTGLSPFFATHGYHVNLLENPVSGSEGSAISPATSARTWLDKQREATAFAQASLAAAQEVQERHANRGRQAAEAFKVGDRVLLRLKNIRTNRPSKKLDWLALPYKVLKTVGSHAVQLNTPPGIHPVFHVSLLRRAGSNPLPSQILQWDEPPPSVQSTPIRTTPLGNGGLSGS